jgi:hypothetical protein
MATTISQIETLARTRLEELTPRFWSSAELTAIIIAGIKDLWRDVVDLKQEHFLTINEDDVTLPASDDELDGVPSDVHKIYLIEPLTAGQDDSNYNLEFEPLDYNHREFRVARALDAVEPKETAIYYATISAGSPVGAPTIKVAPQVTTAVALRFVYVPTISSSLVTGSDVPIPGDCDNALVAWTVAYARAKERDDRAPDPAWLSTYKGEKDRLVKSLGVRNLQEAEFVDPVFKEYY